MKIKIKTLTPIHIGTGKKLGTLEFLSNYRIDYDKLFDMILEENQDEFFNWIDQNPQIDVNQIIQKFKLDRGKVLKKCGLYSFKGSFRKDVNEGIKDSSYKLVIPGSSLKGSLRTALLYKVLLNKHNLLVEYLDHLISDVKRIRSNSKKIKDLLKNSDDSLVNEVFICGVEKVKNDKTEIVYDDQKYDLLKLIKISDSNSVDTYDYGEITEIRLFALKKISQHKPFSIFTESIKANSELEFEISVDIEFLKKAKIELNNKESLFGKKYFIGFENKLKDLFDIDILNDNDITEEKIIDSLIKSWTTFGDAVSQLEKEWVNSIKNSTNANLNSLKELYSTSHKFKVGFGSGFSGMTILSLFLKDEKLKRKLEEFLKLVDIGYHRSSKSSLNIDEFPFTRKYTNNQNVYGGFGWVKLITDEQEQDSGKIITNLKTSERPPNTVIAEIIDDKSKPSKVKILEGEYEGIETILPGVNLIGLGLSKGSKVYVTLRIDKKKLQKADYKGKIN